MASILNFSVSHRGTTHRLSMAPDTPLSVLEEQLQELTGVPPHLQKLIFKGKKAKHEEDASISDLGVKDGAKIQMLGTTTQELEGMKSVENEQQRRERIMRERATKPQYKVCGSAWVSYMLIKPRNCTTRFGRQGQALALAVSRHSRRFHHLRRTNSMKLYHSHTFPTQRWQKPLWRSWQQTPPSGMSCRSTNLLLVS